jgi:hypothetical protein
MTEQTARTIANVALGAAALGAAYYVVRTPPLRRMAVRLAKTALTGAIPAWLAREAQHAWVLSGQPGPRVRL